MNPRIINKVVTRILKSALPCNLHVYVASVQVKFVSETVWSKTAVDVQHIFGVVHFRILHVAAQVVAIVSKLFFFFLND